MIARGHLEGLACLLLAGLPACVMGGQTNGSAVNLEQMTDSFAQSSTETEGSAPVAADGERTGKGRRVHFGTGFKTGEVTPTTARIWTQLTERATPVPVRQERGPGPYRKPIDFDSGMPVELMDGATVPTEGQVRLLLSSEHGDRAFPWVAASGPVELPVDGLRPDTVYTILLEGRARPGAPVTRISGSFRSAPPPTATMPLTFVSVSDQYFWDYDDAERGFGVYDTMAGLEPDFLVFGGDYIYYDKPGPWTHDEETARHKWDAMNAWPALKEFYRHVPVYMQKDDHDTLRDDGHPGSEPLLRFGWEDGIAMWYEQTPVDGLPYRTFRWGRDLQIWLVEGREFRTPAGEPEGPGKTILGKEQKDWLVRTVEASDASFKLFFSPSAVVGPDRDDKRDNHSNDAYAHEGNWLRGFLARKDMIVVIGDRHWQYVSEDPQSGLLEFDKGPASNSHASGWDPADRRPRHRFLRIGAGFLLGELHLRNNGPELRLALCDTEGRILYEHRLSAPPSGP